MKRSENNPKRVSFFRSILVVPNFPFLFFPRRNESDALLSAALLAREAGEEDRARALAAQARERARSEEEAGGGDRPPPDRKEVAERVEREFPETRLNGEKMGDPGDSPPGKEGGSQEV